MIENTQNDINKVIISHKKRLSEALSESASANERLDDRIKKSEDILKGLGYDLPERSASTRAMHSVSEIDEWEKIVEQANKCIERDVSVWELFTEEELASNEEYLIKLREDFDAIHRLDAIDWTIPIVAGILGGVIDVVLCGIPERTNVGTSAGPLSDYIRKLFEKRFPVEEMEKLANSRKSKTPFDAQDNRNTKIYVEGLSSQYHRLLELGHDPILAFIVGVFDVLNRTMTTIDKKGQIVIQSLECYADRGETELFKALAKVLRHLKSDVITSMGIPAPLMGMFNLFQFGSIGEFDQTIAEIVQGMYYEGYDFIHFCSLSVPTMVTEVIVRVAYGIKRKREGHCIRESIALTNSRKRHPKLGTELFIAHTAAAAINAGKVAILGNPLAINYSQWIAFSMRAISQLKWVLYKKPKMRDKYICGILEEEWARTYSETEDLWKEFNNE